MTHSIMFGVAVAAGLIFCGLSTPQVCAQSGWSEPKPLNSYANSDQALLNEEAPHIESDGNGNWLAMWAHPNNTDLALSYSSDTGATWGMDSQFDATSQSRTPGSLHVLGTAAHLYAGDNKWVSVWGVERYYPDPDLSMLYSSYSNDNGTSWSAPVRLDLDGDLSQPLSYVADIQLAADGTGNVLAIFRAGPAPGYFLVRSADYGITWSAPASLSSSNGIPALHEQARIAYAGDNKWLLITTTVTTAGVGDTSRLYKYYASASTDLGNSWTLSGKIFEDVNNTNFIDYDVHVQGDTAVVAFYTNRSFDFEPANVDGYGVIVSTDDGANFSAPIWLERPVIQEYPDVSLAADASGNWAVATSNMYGNPQPVIYSASDPSTSWTKHAVTAGVNTDLEIAGGEAGKFVSVMAHIDPTAPVIHNDADIAAVRSTDGGANWSLPVLVNEFATTDNTQVSDTNVDLESGSSAMLSAWLTRVNTFQGPAATSFSRSETNGFYWDPAAELAKVSTAAPDLVHVNGASWITYWPTQGATQGSIAYSSDDGQTWSAPATLDSSVIATNNNGILIRARSGGFLSRSLDGGLTWESETRPGITTVNHILHTGGNNWLAVAAPSTMLVSNNNGSSWAAHSAPPFTIQGIAADKSGVVVATASTYEDGPNTNDRTVNTYVSRSTDGGITWSPLQLVHTQTRNEAGVVVVFSGHPQPLWLGGDQWAVFPKNILASRTQPLDRNYVRYVDIFYVQSDDGAQTWGTPELAVANSGFDLPTGSDYAVKGNVVTIAYEVDELPDWYDGDILYTNKLIRGTASATDWALFD